jgi:hypothetical protein
LKSSPVINFTTDSTSSLPPPQAQAQVSPSASVNGLSFTVGNSQVQTSSFDFLTAFKWL